MERLEAAMEKARAARRAARSAGVQPVNAAAPAPLVLPPSASVPPAVPAPEVAVPPVPPPAVAPDLVAPAAPEPAADWGKLHAITLPPQLAPRRRLGALMGQEHAAPYDLLRTRVLRQMTEAKWTRLAVTSPNKGCGKSTVSLNLALSLARQPDLRVILMDFDLRRPALAKMLNHSRPDSMALLLEGGVDFADQAVRFGANLALALNHHGVRNSSELLQSARTGEILDAIEARWKPDVMIFDMPPLQGNDDSLGFLGRVDAALLVAAAGSTALSQIDTCEKELAAVTNVMGVVLNKCRYLGSEPGYDAYY
jgi:protein-tyrosine kinase